MSAPTEENYLKRELYELIRSEPSIFDFLQEGSTDGMWYWDIEHPENEWMNPQFWTTLGYDPAEMPHESAAWQDIIFKEDLEVALKNFEQHCADPTHPYDQAVRYRHLDGSTVWIRCRGLAIRDDKGKPKRMLGVHTDITAVRQAMLIERREKYFESMIESAPCGMLIIDQSETIQHANSRILPLFKWTKEEVLGRKITELMPDFELDADAFIFTEDESDASRVQQVGHGLELEGVRQDGKTFFAEVGLSHHKGEDDSHIIASVIDVTQRHEAQRRAFQLAAIVDTSSDAIISETRDGTVTSWNRGAETLYGYSSEEMIGSSALKIVPDDRKSEIPELLARLDKGESVNRFLTKRIGRNGETFDIALTASPIVDDSGKVTAISTIARDITDVKRTESEREAFTKMLARTNEELEFLTYIVSHDLKAPLRGIISLTQWLKEDYGESLDKGGNKMLTQLEQAAKRMTALIDGILKYSHIGRDEAPFENINLKTIIRNAHLLADPEKQLSISLPESLPILKGRQAHLQQVFQNLLSNCVKYIDKAEKKVVIDCQDSGDRWTLRVSDNGKGIDEKHFSQIFDLFRTLDTTKTEGNDGVGLALVRKIVENHGGEISVESTVGEGTDFIIELPKRPLHPKFRKSP